MGLSYAKEGLSKDNKDKMDEAKESFTKAIALDSTNAEAFYGRGKIYQAKKDISDAKSDFASSERLDGDVEEYKTALKDLEK
jgi:tetratricopeptide (TPR) repeat protein